MRDLLVLSGSCRKKEWDVHSGGLKSGINCPLLSPGMALNLPCGSAREGGKKTPEFPGSFPQDPLALTVERDFIQRFVRLSMNSVVLNLTVLSV